MEESVQRCPSEVWFTADDPKQVAVFPCRREKGHEGNHSTNMCETCFVPRDMEHAASPTKVTFRLDWRGQDGVIVRTDLETVN
jgi:hypothetical protein